MLINLFKIGYSVFLSALIGSEREKNNKSAGLRTCILTCVGTTTFTIISLILRQADGTYDIGRMIAYCIVGIGFLGSGSITKNKNSAEGVTTASVMWILAGIGICAGLGEYVLSGVLTLVVYLVLQSKHIKIKFLKR